MRMLLNGLLLTAFLSVTGCATMESELKAPCDPELCHERTPVNSWYKEIA